MKDSFGFSDKITAQARRGAGKQDGLKLTGRIGFVCKDKDGNVRWTEDITNVVVNEGIDYIWQNDTAAATLYVGLIAAGTPAAAWTMSEAGGGTSPYTDANGDREVQDYTGNRPSWTTAVASQEITNTASVASYSITGTVTVTGAFISTNDTKVTTTGTLIAAGTFTGKAVANGDTLEVTYGITGS